MLDMVVATIVLCASSIASAQPTAFVKGSSCTPASGGGTNIIDTLTVEYGDPGAFLYTSKTGVAGWLLAACQNGSMTGGTCVANAPNPSTSVQLIARGNGARAYVGNMTTWHEAWFGPLGGPHTVVYSDSRTITCPTYPCQGCGGSPILIPSPKMQLKDGKVIKVSDVAHGAAFDLDGDGVVENLGWPEKGAAFLAIDRNGNGVIDNGRELFGTENGFYNGFEELRSYAPSAGYLDATHSIWSQLLLWSDDNRDGVSQPDELKPAGTWLTKIGLGAEVVNQLDSNGNNFKWRGWAEYVVTGRASRLSEDAYPIWDVIFARK